MKGSSNTCWWFWDVCDHGDVHSVSLSHTHTFLTQSNTHLLVIMTVAEEVAATTLVEAAMEEPSEGRRSNDRTTCILSLSLLTG